MNDLITRQAAIDAICNACGKIDCDKMDKCEKLQLPPANCSEFPNNSDTISRQAAIDALDKRFGSIPMEQTTEILLLRKDLRELPSAQPERKKGEWVLQSDDYHEYYECDQCGIAVGLDDVRNFCPNCGAKMKGAKHETDTNVCNSSEMPNSSDYIRREDAVDAVAFGITTAKAIDIETGESRDLFANENEELRRAIKRLKALPPADVVQVRHGKWKKIGVWGRVYRCNQCGNFLDFDGVNAGRGGANFCPNCGAKMDGERKE